MWKTRKDGKEAHPIFCCLPNEGTLTPTGTRITFHGMSSRPHEIIQLRELDDQPIPVVFVERPSIKISVNESISQRLAGLFLRVA